MPYRAQIDDRGVVSRYKDTDTGEVISAKEYERRIMAQQGGYYMAPTMPMQANPQMQAVPPQGGSSYSSNVAPIAQWNQQQLGQQEQGFAPVPQQAVHSGGYPAGGYPNSSQTQLAMGQQQDPGTSSLVQPGAQMLSGNESMPSEQTQGQEAGVQKKNLRMEGVAGHQNSSSHNYRTHGFLDATSIAILLPTLVLLALIIAAAHKKRLFPWQTIRTFNPPSGLMSPRDYERSFVCPPNLRRHGRMGKRNPQATWAETDGIVIPFGFLARTHLPVTIPLGRLPNKNMFIVAPSGSGKTTLMRAIMKALLAKPCVMIALEAKANDPNLDEKKESFKHTVLPEAKAAGFDCLYFNPLDQDSVHWNPLDLDPTSFASSIVQDINSLDAEEQHWAERDHGYICGLVKLLKWGAVQVAGEDENGQPSDLQPLPCNPRGLMRLVNNRRNIVESLRRLKNNPNVDQAELNEQTLTLSSIIRTDTDWDKNIQGVRGRLRMFRNEGVLRVTEQSNIDIKTAMHRPTVLIFGAPASLGPDAESLAACFVYQLQQALHTRYGTVSVLPLFAFFDEYQTLNIDLAGRLSAIVRGANGGLAVILQNISQIAGKLSADPTSGGASELKTLFSNCAIRVCLHNADESTSKFFSDEIGKHAVIVPGISDHYEANGFGIFPSKWNRIHSQQVVARVDTDSIKRMEKQHALVYLSPAGDPEFGEAKPFMVDLRGIEEIARLHLLHNVTSRTGQAPPETNSLNPMTPAAKAVGNSVFDVIKSAGTAGVGAVLSTSAKLLPGQDNNLGAPNSHHNNFAGQNAGVQTGGDLSASSNSQGTQNQNNGPNTERLCPHCQKSPGKGRFCIECGKFVGATSGPVTNPNSNNPASDASKNLEPASLRSAVNDFGAALPQTAQQFGNYAKTSTGPVSTGFSNQAETSESAGDNSRPPFPFANQTSQMSSAQQAQASDSHLGAAGRKPVTSLHADLSQFGISNNNADKKSK